MWLLKPSMVLMRRRSSLITRSAVPLVQGRFGLLRYLVASVKLRATSSAHGCPAYFLAKAAIFSAAFATVSSVRVLCMSTARTSSITSLTKRDVSPKAFFASPARPAEGGQRVPPP